MRVQYFEKGPEEARCLVSVTLPGDVAVLALGSDEDHARRLVLRKLLNLARAAEEMAESIALNGNELIAAMGEPRTNTPKPWA